MSVRAYRVIKKEVANDPSFNLWHDDELIDFLKEQNVEGQDGYIEYLSEEGGGSVEVSVYALQKALDNFKWEEGGDYRPKSIKDDITFAKEKGDSYVLYECY